jgi:hypothetical protein
VATQVARNAYEALVELMVGSGGVRVWREVGVCSRFCVGAFGTNLASVAVNMFLRLI